MRPARVIDTNFEPGRRVVAISDIHGNLPFFQGLLNKIGFSRDDILVLVGDMIEKGQPEPGKPPSLHHGPVPHPHGVPRGGQL